MKRSAIVLILSLSLAAPAAAGQFEDGVAAYQHGDYDTALRLWRPLAEQGNAWAQSKLGFMYEFGIEVPIDYAEAVRWYRKAADQGSARAEHDLGVMYNEGKGVPQDYAEAVRWWRKAAEQGDVGAQLNLGLMYESGKGVPQDYVEAYLWFNLAADQSRAAARDQTVEKRDAVAAKMTAAQIAEAQQLAREWKRSR